MISSLCSFLSADSEIAMIINKINFSYVLQAISVFYIQKHPHATTTHENHVQKKEKKERKRKKKKKKCHRLRVFI